LNQVGNPLGEHFALAALVSAEKLANAKAKHYLTASTGNVMNRSLVLAVNMF
jgi:hypothetical protein